MRVYHAFVVGDLLFSDLRKSNPLGVISSICSWKEPKDVKKQSKGDQIETTLPLTRSNNYLDELAVGEHFKEKYVASGPGVTLESNFGSIRKMLI